MIPGRGVCAVADGKKILAGNPELLQEYGVEITSNTGMKNVDLADKYIKSWLYRHLCGD